MAQYRERFLDRSAYSNKCLDTYRIIGCHFVDIFYNHLYDEAIKLKNDGKVASVTEGYRHAIYAFISALDPQSSTYRAHHYSSLLQGIQECFAKYVVVSITIRDVIDKIVTEFVPEQFNKSLSVEQKSRIIRDILLNTVRAFVRTIAQEYINLIIDNHEDPSSVDILKEKIVDIFIIQRVNMYQKFVKSATAGETTDAVQLVSEKASREIQQLVMINKTLTEEKAMMRKVIAVRAKHHKQMMEAISKLQNENASLNKKLELLNHELATRARANDVVVENESASDDEQLVDFVLPREKMSVRGNNVAAGHSVPQPPQPQPVQQQPVQQQPVQQYTQPTQRPQQQQPTQQPIVQPQPVQQPTVRPHVQPIQQHLKPPTSEFPPGLSFMTQEPTKPVPRKRNSKKRVEYDEAEDVDDILKSTTDTRPSVVVESSTDLEAFMPDE